MEMWTNQARWNNHWLSNPDYTLPHLIKLLLWTSSLWKKLRVIDYWITQPFLKDRKGKSTLRVCTQRNRQGTQTKLQLLPRPAGCLKNSIFFVHWRNLYLFCDERFLRNPRNCVWNWLAWNEEIVDSCTILAFRSVVRVNLIQQWYLGFSLQHRNRSWIPVSIIFKWY